MIVFFGGGRLSHPAPLPQMHPGGATRSGAGSSVLTAALRRRQYHFRPCRNKQQLRRAIFYFQPNLSAPSLRLAGKYIIFQ